MGEPVRHALRVAGIRKTLPRLNRQLRADRSTWFGRSDLSRPIQQSGSARDCAKAVDKTDRPKGRGAFNTFSRGFPVLRSVDRAVMAVTDQTATPAPSAVAPPVSAASSHPKNSAGRRRGFTTLKGSRKGDRVERPVSAASRLDARDGAASFLSAGVARQMQGVLG